MTVDQEFESAYGSVGEPGVEVGSGENGTLGRESKLAPVELERTKVSLNADCVSLAFTFSPSLCVLLVGLACCVYSCTMTISFEAESLREVGTRALEACEGAGSSKSPLYKPMDCARPLSCVPSDERNRISGVGSGGAGDMADGVELGVAAPEANFGASIVQREQLCSRCANLNVSNPKESSDSDREHVACK